MEQWFHSLVFDCIMVQNPYEFWSTWTLIIEFSFFPGLMIVGRIFSVLGSSSELQIPISPCDHRVNTDTVQCAMLPRDDAWLARFMKYIFFFSDGVSLCSPRWPWTHPPASASECWDFRCVSPLLALKYMFNLQFSTHDEFMDVSP
jgi:hypothetical protein